MEEINEENFESKISKGNIIIDFWAEWCGPCKMLAPVLEEISKSHKDVKFMKINVDDNQVLASQFSIMSIPTLIFFKEGEYKDQLVGAVGKEQLKKWIDKNL